MLVRTVILSCFSCPVTVILFRARGILLLTHLGGVMKGLLTFPFGALGGREEVFCMQLFTPLFCVPYMSQC